MLILFESYPISPCTGVWAVIFFVYCSYALLPIWIFGALIGGLAICVIHYACLFLLMVSTNTEFIWQEVRVAITVLQQVVNCYFARLDAALAPVAVTVHVWVVSLWLSENHDKFCVRYKIGHTVKSMFFSQCLGTAFPKHCKQTDFPVSVILCVKAPPWIRGRVPKK